MNTDAPPALPIQSEQRLPLAPTGGEDTLDVGLFVDFTEDAWASLIPILEKAKAAAQEKEAPEENEWISMNGIAAHVLEKGFGKKNAVFYHWVLDSLGVRLAIAKRRVPDDYTSRANVRVQIGSLVLMRDGITVVWESIKAMIAAMGGEIKGNKVSRVDMALDLPGQSVIGFTSALFEDRIVSYADGFQLYGQIAGVNAQTLYIGSGKFMARIYDKVAEIRKSKDEAKWSVLKEKRWHGEDQDVASRVEFQISREGLKECGVESMEDWIRMRAGVAEYLTMKWFRIAAEPVDRKHGDLAKNAALWDTVHQGFADVYGQAPPVERTHSPRPDPSQLTRAALGNLISAVACGETLPQTIGDVRKKTKELCDRAARDLEKKFAEHLETRLAKHGVDPERRAEVVVGETPKLLGMMVHDHRSDFLQDVEDEIFVTVRRRVLDITDELWRKGCQDQLPATREEVQRRFGQLLLRENYTVEMLKKAQLRQQGKIATGELAPNDWLAAGGVVGNTPPANPLLEDENGFEELLF